MQTIAKKCKKPKKTTLVPNAPVPEGPFAPPLLLGRKFKLPRLRDRKAFELSQRGRTQAEIAEKLDCSQATVCRGIRRVESWRARTLPEERKDMTNYELFFIACDRQQALLARLQRRALEDYEQSKQPVPIKKTITTTHKTNEEGEKVIVRVEEWLKPQAARGSLLAAAERLGTAATLLAGGCVGSGRGSVMVAEAIDPDERARWHQGTKARDEQIAKMGKRNEHLQEQLAVAYNGDVPLHVSDPELAAACVATRKTCVTAEDHRREDELHNALKNQKRMEAKKRMERALAGPAKSELRSDEKGAEMHQENAGDNGVTACATETCGEGVHPEEQRENSVGKVNNELAARLPPGNGLTRGSARAAGVAARVEPSAGEEAKPARRLILESHNSACVPLQESELLELEKDGLAWLTEIGELIATLTPINEYDTTFRNNLIKLWRNSERNYHRHGILPERQKFPRLESIRRGSPYTMSIPLDRDKYSRG